MAQTHDDKDSLSESMPGPTEDAMSDLEQKAREMTAEGKNVITSGGDPIEVHDVAGMRIERRADDKFCLRISIGGGGDLGSHAYLNYRGNILEVRNLLQRALNAFNTAYK